MEMIRTTIMFISLQLIAFNANAVWFSTLRAADYIAADRKPAFGLEQLKWLKHSQQKMFIIYKM